MEYFNLKLSGRENKAIVMCIFTIAVSYQEPDKMASSTTWVFLAAVACAVFMKGKLNCGVELFLVESYTSVV